MDCRTARLLLDYARPHRQELPADEAAPLEAHLAGCPDCDTLARIDRQADERLGKAMCDVPIPEGLRQGILDRLQAERLQRQRRRLAWAVRAVAAAVLIGLFGWWWVHTHPAPRPQLDPHGIVDAFSDSNKDAEQVEAFFREEYQVATVAPPMFNYGLLCQYDLHKIPALAKGPRVPWLQFRDRGRGHMADVYVLSAKQIDVQNLTSGRRLADTKGWKVELWPNSEHPDIFYLILYTSDSLDLFLSEGSGQAT
jgi:hypothetical protein